MDPRSNLENYINAETHFERTKCRVIYDQEIIDVSYQPYKLPSINNLSLVFDNEINYKYKSTDHEIGLINCLICVMMPMIQLLRMDLLQTQVSVTLHCGVGWNGDTREHF